MNSPWQFEAIGTQWAIETSVELSTDIKDKITRRIAEFDSAYSRFREDSLVARIAEKAGVYEFPADVVELIDIYEKLYDATEGAVSPLIGDSLSALGYDKNYSLQPGESKDVPKWSDVMSWDGRTVTTTQPVLLDFGAVGKGYLVDRIGEILENNDFTEYVVDASGDIRQRGNDAQTVGLENPFDEMMVIGVIELRNASLCASATNRRRWGNGLHHVIDGRTGRPTDDIAATWVMSKTTALSDGLATALFFVPAKKLTKLSNFQFVRLHNDGFVEHSRDFVGQLYI